MRRRPGIGGLQRAAKERDQYKIVGNIVQETKLEHVKAQMAQFKRSLEEFAMKHRNDIKSDPIFRARFHAMCANVGVDPLASNKGMWAQLLGFGDFYYELGVQIVEACLLTRSFNGGLLELKTLQRMVQKRRGSASAAVSEDDIARAIDKLKALGGGFDLVKLGPQRLVRSVPGELSTDTNAVLEQAAGKGCVSASQLRERLGWSDARVSEALGSLLREGLAWVDDGDPGGRRLFWIPCVDPAASPG